MAEKRSVPTAMGLLIGPALGYLSYLVLSSGSSEALQLLCFAGFLLAGHDLVRGGLSLTGVLAVLFLPALPIAMYLNSVQVGDQQHLGPAMIIGFWVGSALLGAIFAGTRPARSATGHVTRLAGLAVALLVLVLAGYFVS